MERMYRQEIPSPAEFAAPREHAMNGPSNAFRPARVHRCVAVYALLSTLLAASARMAPATAPGAGNIGKR